MSSLVKRSFRDLWRARWQAAGIACLVAIVTGMVCGGVHTYAILSRTVDGWYERLAMADLEITFSPVHPGVLERAEGLDGIAAMEERLLVEGVLKIEGHRSLPALVRVLPVGEPPRVNRIEVLDGRYPEPGEAALLVDRSVVDEYGTRVGDVVTLEVGENVLSLPVVGVSLSPEYILFPVHPEYTLPLRGTVAVVQVSKAATVGIEHADRVNSVVFRFEKEADPIALKYELLAALPVAASSVEPLSQDPGRVFSRMIIETFEIYMPSIATVCVGVAILLLALTHARLVRRQEATIGTLLALGHTPRQVAMTFAAMAIVPTLIGSAVGAWSQGPFARYLFRGYASSVGFAPAIDPGPGLELPLTILVCFAVSLLACVLPALRFARAHPANLLRPVQDRRGRRQQGIGVRIAAMLRDVLRLPISVVLGLTNLARRRWATLSAVLGLGAIFGLVLAFLMVHVTHRVELTASVSRMGLDATVMYADPVGDDVLQETARLANGTAEPMVSKLAMLECGNGPMFRRLICVGPDGWVNKLEIREGRLFADTWANEILVDRWIADNEGLGVGDTVDAFPYANAPEGATLTVVGIIEGVTLGTAVIPLEVGRSLFGLAGASTGAHVSSPMDEDALEAAVWQAPGVESVFGMKRAAARVEANFKGSEQVLMIALFLSICIAVVFLGILAALDAADRAPDLAVLQALGWRNRSLLGLCLTEVMGRGIAALALAIPLAPVLARWLLGRLETANHYRMVLVQPGWLLLLVCGLALALIPLGALPALRAAQRVTPARAMRILTRE